MAGIHRRWRTLPRWVRWPAVAALSLGVLGVVGFAYLWLTVELPDDPPALQSAVVLDQDGEQVAVLSQEGERFLVSLDEVAPVVVDALVSAEDRRFYDHTGVDPVGIARALVQNVRSAGTQGGSTLTQQLVKNEYLSSERSIQRKVREAILSLKLERSEDKDRILERYLNTVYFGRGAYGIEAAARRYFGRHAAELDTAQAAFLVGLLRSPETADPAEDPLEAERRRATVLADMVANDRLTQAEADAAAATEIGASGEAAPTTPEAGVAPHFVEWVRQQVVETLGEDALYRQGLRVVTTLDLDAQRAAETAVAETLTLPEEPQAALVALDADGAIRAYVGGRDYAALKVDLARGAGGSGRQAGSTFKPFVLQAALQQGATLGDRFAGPPQLVVDVGGQPFDVENYGGESFADLTLAEATEHSVNTVYAQLVAKVGPDAVAEAATADGIDAELDRVPAIALGTEEVSPLDLASAYATFAADGTRTEPYAILRIEDADGVTVWEPEPAAQVEAVDPDVSRAVTHALRGVVERGTGRAADIGRPVAGKTGTTQDNVDAWFAGYVPGYTAVVWMGFPEAATPMDDVQGRPVTGGYLPAQIWQRFMTAAMEGREVEDFPAPPEDRLRPADSTTSSTSSSTSSTEPGSSTTAEDTDTPTSAPPGSSTTTSSTTSSTSSSTTEQPVSPASSAPP
jgi:penicillin-binding protein 1A